MTSAVTFLENYKWSSYRDYIGMPTFPTVTQRNFFLDFFGGEQKCKEIIEEWIRYKAKNTQFGPEIIE
ncbi:hypothetical protein IIA94_02415 [Patescibacteria group bacterium]|nr:hypothetical protein [Patescibacteria group bacterium]